MKISEAMTSDIVTVDMDDRLITVKKILDSAPFRHLLVMEDEELQGLISDRDILRCLSPFIGTDAESVRDAKTMDQRAHQVMTRSPIIVSSDAMVQDALLIMVEHSIGCLPVVDAGKVVGIFTLHDGIKVLLDK
jgi:acetoin utilization protein AcuB